MGDYVDFCRTTFRAYIKSYQADESSVKQLNSIAYGIEDDLYRRYLKRIEKKCLGLIEGNHTWICDKGISTGQRLASKMGCPYCFDMGGVNLVVEDGREKGIQTLRILVHHGDFGGSAITPGGDLNSMVKRGSSWLVDVNLFAHTHKKMAYKEPLMTWGLRGRHEIQEIPHAYIRTGGFLRGYRECDERGRYAEKKMLKPNELGHVTIKLRFAQTYSAALAQERRGASGRPGHGTTPLALRMTLET